MVEPRLTFIKTPHLFNDNKNLTYDLSFYNKILSFFVILLLLLLKYAFNFKQNKKHFSSQRNALTLEG
ncbi:hypothetical protein PMEGAPL103_30700 [Priestia megaterium]